MIKSFLILTHWICRTVLLSNREFKELGDVDDDAKEDDRKHVRHDPRPLGRVRDGVVIFDRLRDCQIPFHGQRDRNVDAAAEIDVPEWVEEVNDGKTMQRCELDDESFLDALKDREKQEDAVE